MEKYVRMGVEFENNKSSSYLKYEWNVWTKGRFEHGAVRHR